MKHKKFNLESELRASRSQPRADFARGLADEVRSTGAATRSPRGRVGLALALSGLIVVALASFGGMGYASSSASHAVKKPAVAKHAQKPSKSAAQAQYAPFTPPTTNKIKPTTPTTEGTNGSTGSGTAGAGTGQAGAPKATSSQLPFTGLALWVPLAVGLMLISLGLVLRTRGRRRHTSAH
jgi:hypothetical protein